MDLSIIILSFNTKKYTKECIESVIKHIGNVKYEIIVVDNNSKDGSAEMLRKIKNLKLILNNKNMGFAAGNNKGLKRAKGKYILLLNSDTKVTSNLFDEILQWMDENKKTGIASCALLNRGTSVQPSGGFFPTLARVFAWMFFIDDLPFVGNLFKPFHPQPSHFKNQHEQDWVTGAFFLIRQELIGQIGYFDEDYFMYVEEMDYCYRAKKQDWKVMYIPDWSIIHYGQASSTSRYAILSEYKGIKHFFRKHYPLWKYPFLRLFLAIGALLRIFIFGILEGPVAIKTYAKAITKA